MPMEMTDNARAAMRCAGQEARWFGSGAVESVHLLLCLMKRPESAGARVLKELGINFKKVSLALESTAPETRSDMTADLPHSANLKRIVLAAEGEAEARRRVRLGTEHLLMGILKVSESRAAKVLSRFEVTVEKASPLISRLLVKRETDEVSQGDAAAIADVDIEVAARGPEATKNVYRILDANLNRAGEAIRVVEECARFVMDHPILAREAKGLRHRLHHAMEKLEIPSAELLAARDTAGDVGTLLSGVGDVSRATLSAVLKANFRRLAESLRALEEYVKLVRKPWAAFERLRYEAYELEKAYAHPERTRASLEEIRLCVLVGHSRSGRAALEVLEEVLDGGCRMVQLREKDLPDRELLDLARKARHLTQQAGALLIINDRADVARQVGADGVHVGQTDLPLVEVRKIIGLDRLVGVSTHSVEQASEAESAGADYIGVGPVFHSSTKPKLGSLGVELVRSVASIRIPFFAIGGITLENLPRVQAVGATRVAVGSAVRESDEICEATRRFLAELQNAG